MRYDPVDPNLFITNRQRLQSELKANEYAVLRAKKGQIGSETDYVPFRQNRDFFWATGIDEPWAVLVLTKSTEVLFVKRVAGIEQQWNGDRINLEQASVISGIRDVRPLAKLRTYQKQLPGQVADIGARLAYLRSVKQPIEIDLIKRAISITADGNQGLLSAIVPGVKEYELEAKLSYAYTKNGSKHAFEPIIASGQAATIIHYIGNAGVCRDGDAVIVDVGAEYANYAADISRTYPVSGRFNQRQREIYEAVLDAQEYAISMLKPGVLLRENEQLVHERIGEALMELGVIKRSEVSKEHGPWKEAFKYFPHGTSHFLGLDVHDAGDYTRPLEPGMVLSAEPGIYLPQEGIGIRIEDDVLITADGSEVLSRDIPKDTDELEKLINNRHR